MASKFLESNRDNCCLRTLRVSLGEVVKRGNLTISTVSLPFSFSTSFKQFLSLLRWLVKIGFCRTGTSIFIMNLISKTIFRQTISPDRIMVKRKSLSKKVKESSQTIIRKQNAFIDYIFCKF